MSDDSPRAPWLLLRAGAVPAVLTGLVVTAAAVTAGSPAVVGAAAGTVLSVTALAAGPLLLRAARGVSPAMLFALAVTTYAAVVGVLLATFSALGDVPQVDGRWLGGAIIACTSVWLAGQARQTSRLRLLAFGDRESTG